MARERMVTRTIKMDKVCILTMNKADRAVVERVFRINAELKLNDSEIVTLYNDMHSDTVAIMVLSHDVKDRLFSMAEEKFMMYATEGPARGEKEEG